MNSLSSNYFYEIKFCNKIFSKKLIQWKGTKKFFSTGLNDIFSHPAKIEELKQEYLHHRKWKEIEPMDAFLHQALQNTSKYVESLNLSSEEKEQFQALKFWYQNEYFPQKSTHIPLIKLEALGNTSEATGGDHLKENEVAFYLENGVVGPIAIESITHYALQSIPKKLKDFHKKSNRNSGSVYSMLKIRDLFKLVFNREILSKVSSILGDNIILTHLTINERAPSMRNSIETGELSDALNCQSDLATATHTHFEPKFNSIKNLTLDNRCVNAWISLSGTDASNAPLYFFPKTHKWEIATPFTHIDRAKNNRSALDHVLKLLSFKRGSAVRRIGLYNMEFQDLLISQYRTLIPKILRTEIYTEPGDCILFNAHTRHGFGFNSSSKSHLAIALQFKNALTEVGGLEYAQPVVTRKEREKLGILGDKRKPIIQVMGKEHHENNLPIDISHLL